MRVINNLLDLSSGEREALKELGLSERFLQRTVMSLREHYHGNPVALSVLAVNPAVRDLHEWMLQEVEGSHARRAEDGGRREDTGSSSGGPGVEISSSSGAEAPVSGRGEFQLDSADAFGPKPLTMKAKSRKESMLGGFILVPRLGTIEGEPKFVGAPLHFPLSHLMALCDLGYIECVGVDPNHTFRFRDRHRSEEKLSSKEAWAKEPSDAALLERNPLTEDMGVKGARVMLAKSDFQHTEVKQLFSEYFVQVPTMFEGKVPEKLTDAIDALRELGRRNPNLRICPKVLDELGHPVSVPVLAVKDRRGLAGPLVISDIDAHAMAVPLTSGERDRRLFDTVRPSGRRELGESATAFAKEHSEALSRGEEKAWFPVPATMGKLTVDDYVLLNRLAQDFHRRLLVHGPTSEFIQNIDEMTHSRQATEGTFPAVEPGRQYAIVFSNGQCVIGNGEEILLTYWIMQQLGMNFNMQQLWVDQLASQDGRMDAVAARKEVLDTLLKADVIQVAHPTKADESSALRPAAVMSDDVCLTSRTFEALHRIAGGAPDLSSALAVMDRRINAESQRGASGVYRAPVHSTEKRDTEAHPSSVEPREREPETARSSAAVEKKSESPRPGQ